MTFDVAFTRYTVDRSLNRIRLGPDGNQTLDEDGFGVVDPIAGTQTSRDATQRSFQYVAKLTYSPNEHHKFTLMDLGVPTFAGGDGSFSIDQQSGLPEPLILDMYGDLTSIRHRNVALSNDLAIKYEGNFDEKKSLLDISFGWHHQQFGTLPADGSQPGDATGDASIPRIIYRRSEDFDGNPNPHTITDFSAADGDRIQILATNFGLIPNSTPVLLSGSTLPTPSTSGGQFLYNASNGALWFDRDGADSGFAAVQVATLSNRPTLSASDLQLVLA